MSTRPEWKKPDPALVARFDSALPDHPAAERKKMFGNPVCFVNGYFFAGLHNDSFVVRLPGSLREKFSVLRGAEVFDPMGTGKGMKDWWLIPAAISESDAELAELLAGAFTEVVKLPPKEPGTRASSKTRAPKRGGARTQASLPSLRGARAGQ
jgi:TfoX/Sxy family transcriptional regulator of competence genes